MFLLPPHRTDQYATRRICKKLINDVFVNSRYTVYVTEIIQRFQMHTVCNVGAPIRKENDDLSRDYEWKTTTVIGAIPAKNDSHN